MASGKRKALKISEEDFKAYVIKKVKDKTGEDYDEFDLDEEFDMDALAETFPKIEKDLEKIEFDFENYSISEDLGLTTVNDFTFIGVEAGGDWEEPVFFILYLDNKKQLRGYIPTSGNVFNVRTKSAYGNDEDEDDIAAQKFGFADYDEMRLTLDFEYDKLLEDILNRIETV